MTATMTMRTVTCVLLVSSPFFPSAADAQSAAVTAAKALYTSAAYDQALASLATDDGEEAQEYRALCLLALGRADEATRVTEALVTAHPTFTVSDEETSPRFVALLTETRRRLLPTVMRERFANARERFQARSYDDARRQFREVLTLSSDPLVKGSEDAADLAVLAQGFLDLATAAATTAPTPAPAPVTVAVTAPAAPPVIVPPVAIRQVVPPWPRSAVGADATVTVSLRVSIGTDGRVKSATIEGPTRPQYDGLLVAAAKSWLYTPGTLNGTPVPMDKVVSLIINTR